MADQPRFVRDDVYDEIAATFQCVEVAELDEALRDCGIDDPDLRRRVCERFAFGMGNFLDQCWFKAEGKRYYPLVCFVDAFLNVDTEPSELGVVYAPSRFFAFHEYARGAVHWVFNPDDGGGPIEVGTVGEEGDGG